MGTDSYIMKLDKDSNKITGVYCAYNSGLDGFYDLGNILIKFFQNDEKINQLLFNKKTYSNGISTLTITKRELDCIVLDEVITESFSVDHDDFIDGVKKNNVFGILKEPVSVQYFYLWDGQWWFLDVYNKNQCDFLSLVEYHKGNKVFRSIGKDEQLLHLFREYTDIIIESERERIKCAIYGKKVNDINQDGVFEHLLEAIRDILER